jgi:hypothetical protein
LTVTVPFSAISTVRSLDTEALLPRTKDTARATAFSLDRRPAVLTVMLQGLTVTVLPRARGDEAGKVDVVTVKMHEPNPRLPLAEPSEELTLKLEALFSVTVVAEVVPKLDTPDEKTKGSAVTPATELAVTAAVTLLDATNVCGSSPPPPHAANMAAAAKRVRPSFFIRTPY